MRERPILFSGPMVRAILEGRKTQTRRIAIPRHDDKTPCEHWAGRNASDGQGVMMRHCEHGSEGGTCPQGHPGNLLWVKETWKVASAWDSFPPSRISPAEGSDFGVRYRADGDTDLSGKWRPSIFMPRWASRITLEITGVRVGRVQDISNEDAESEGINRIAHGMNGYYFHATRTEPHPGNWCSADDAFRELWDSINAKRGLGWETNPWVWVIEFRKL